jgi:hypothetical protein
MKMATTSANFDYANVAPFLRRLIPLMSNGFKMHDVARVQRLLQRMKVDQTCQIRFPVRYRGRDVELVVRAFMDDLAGPDMEFETDDGLCVEIRTELARFFDELGL